MGLKEFYSIVDEAADITARWAQMKKDRETCERKVERLRSELTFIASEADAQVVMGAIRVMQYTIGKYDLEMERFPERLASIRARCLTLALSSSDIGQVKRQGLN